MTTAGLVKISPLADWTEEQVWDYVRTHRVSDPSVLRSGLYQHWLRTVVPDPISAGEDHRAGRWWVEENGALKEVRHALFRLRAAAFSASTTPFRIGTGKGFKPTGAQAHSSHTDAL